MSGDERIRQARSIISEAEDAYCAASDDTEWHALKLSLEAQITAALLFRDTEIERLRRDCAELYQVIGTMAEHCPDPSDPEIVKALDNASDAANGDPRRHDDLLPFVLPEPRAYQQHMVGEYRADYSPLTEAEIAAPTGDKELDALNVQQSRRR